MAQNTVRIANIPFTSTDENLVKFLKDNGVTNIPTDFAIRKRKTNGHSLGIAFLVCPDQATVDKVLELNKKPLEDRTLRITLLKDKRIRTKVFIRNIPVETTPEALTEKLKEFGVGATTEITLNAVRNKERNSGNGTLTFESEDAAKAGFEKLKNVKMDDRELRCYIPSGLSTVVRVLNVPYSATQESFEAAIKPHVQPKITQLNYPQCSAELTFANEDDAKKALAALAGKTYGTNTLRSDFSTVLKPRPRRAKDEKGEKGAKKKKQTGTRAVAQGERVAKPKPFSIKVEQLPPQMKEDDLKQIFEGMDFTSVSIVSRNDTIIGYAYFNTRADAEKAYDTCKETTVEGKLIELTLLRPRQRRTRTPKSAGGKSTPKGKNEEKPKRSERPKREPRKHSDVVDNKAIMIKNLAYKAEAGDIVKAFEAYNAQSANVVRTFNGRSRGFGFVHFGSAADAEKALKVGELDICGRVAKLLVAYEKIEPTPAATEGK